MPDCYRIELRRIGYRLMYEVSGAAVAMTVVTL